LHRRWADWWVAEACSDPTRRAGEYGVPQHVIDIPRADKVFGRIFFLKAPKNNSVTQANLYLPTELLTVAVMEARLRRCPWLAAGSLVNDDKPEGGHLSAHNLKFRTKLNFSLVVGLSYHGDKEFKKDVYSTICHAWVTFAHGCDTVHEKRLAVALLCNLCG
jgi:hypothetical protein